MNSEAQLLLSTSSLTRREIKLNMHNPLSTQQHSTTHTINTMAEEEIDYNSQPCHAYACRIQGE
jgi:hypothetical protein